MNPILSLVRTMPQYVTYTGGAASIDTLTDSGIFFSEKVTIPWIAAVVRDTVESTSDTALFRLDIGGQQVLRKSAAQFKIGTPGKGYGTVYRWDVNKEAIGALRVKLTRAAVTEGTYKFLIHYVVTDNK